MNQDNRLNKARQVFEEEIQALEQLKNELDETFSDLISILQDCLGKVIVCGMGKSGHIARKISATLSSLGTPSFFLHPAEALHGDLGMVSKEDVVILISNSGETEEIIRLIPSIRVIGAKLIGITGVRLSSLAKSVDVVQIIHVDKEACALNLAPTSSTTATLVYGDALAVVASIESGFCETDFGLFHPSGTLGKRVLTRVGDIMATNEAVPMIYTGMKITDAIMEMSKKELGVVAIVAENQKLIGLLTDGDLRRAIEKRADLYNDIIDSIMTRQPKSVKKDILLVDALQKLKESRLNNYPVVDEDNRLIGMLTWQMIVREGIVL